MRGSRRKTPIIIKRLDGFPHKGPVAEKLAALDMMVPTFGAVFIPEHIHQDAQACIQVIKDSMPFELYSRADTYTLATFACAWAVHMRASHELANPEFDWVVTDANGKQVPNPWIRIMFDAGKQVANLGSLLGLNPSARASLRLPGKDRQQRDTSLDLL